VDRKLFLGLCCASCLFLSNLTYISKVHVIFLEALDGCSHCHGEVPASSIFSFPIAKHSTITVPAVAPSHCPVPLKTCSASSETAGCTTIQQPVVNERVITDRQDQDLSAPVRLFGRAPTYELQLPRTNRKYALIVGTGASANTITPTLFKQLQPYMDVWAVNQLQWHNGIVPDYWHFEPAPFQTHPEMQPPPSIIAQWIHRTILICEQACHHLKHMEWSAAMQKRYYRRASINCDSPCVPKDAHYKPERDEVHVPCCSSLNRVLELIQRMGFEQVFMIGFDGDTSMYFEDKTIYSNPPPYRKLMSRIQSKKNDKYMVKKEGPHATSLFGLDQFTKEFFKFHNIKQVNLFPSSKSKMMEDVPSLTVPELIYKLQNDCKK